MCFYDNEHESRSVNKFYVNVKHTVTLEEFINSLEDIF